MNIFTALLIATCILLAPLAIKSVIGFFARRKMDKLFMASSLFRAGAAKRLREIISDRGFISAANLTPVEPIYRGSTIIGSWQKREVIISSAKNTKRRLSDAGERATLIYLSFSNISVPRTIISSRSFRSLSSLPVTKLPLIDLSSYPSFRKRFVVQTEDEQALTAALTFDVIRSIEGLAEVSVEFSPKGALFCFYKGEFNYRILMAQLDDAMKLVESLELTFNLKKMQG